MKLHFLAAALLIVGCSSTPPSLPYDWLEGSWSAPAFDGELHESWAVDDAALVVKEGYYIEGNDTLYAEQVRIDSIFGGIYLLAQPRGGTPVIFRLSELSESSMVFVNQGNRNPFRILYQREDEDHFVRTTFGLEAGDTVSNRFAFTRISSSPR